MPNFGTVEYNAAVIEDNGVADVTPVDRGRPILLRASAKTNWCTTTTFAAYRGPAHRNRVGRRRPRHRRRRDRDEQRLHGRPQRPPSLHARGHRPADCRHGLQCQRDRYDQFENPLGSDYTGTPTLSGNFSPSARGCGTGNASPCSALYANPPSVSTGVATWTGVTAFKAETLRNVTATDGVTGTSNDFTVIPNQPTTPPTVQLQPTLTQFNTKISPAVEVKVEDFWGNPRQGDTVTIALGPNPDGGPSSGCRRHHRHECLGHRDFRQPLDHRRRDRLEARRHGDSANADSRTNGTSVAFDIANQVSTCAGNCTATGSTPNRNKATVNAFGLGGGALARRLGPATSAQALSARIGMTVAGGTASLSPRTRRAATSHRSVTRSGSPRSRRKRATRRPTRSLPAWASRSKRIRCDEVRHLPRSHQRQRPPPPGCKTASSATVAPTPRTSNSWPTKDGTCARFFNGYYWGLVRDYPSSQVNNTTGCPGSPTFPSPPPFNLFPGVYKKQKNGNDIVITFCKPSPWDGGGGWR